MPKLTSYTVKFKLEVLRWYRAHDENERATAKHFGVSRKSIYSWRKNFDKLIAHDNSRDRQKRKITVGPSPLCPQLDDRLFDFFMDERIDGRAVTNGALKKKALEFAEKLKLQNFNASSGYIRNFKKRMDISMRRGTNECQRQPEQLTEILHAWRLSIRNHRRREDYLLHEIANMDETMCRFDMPYDRTNELKGKKTIRIKNTGHKKKGCTVALCAFANGEKLPAYCIFKESKGHLGKRVLAAINVPDNVFISASRNGWMVAVNFSEWCNKIWKQTEDPDLRRRLLVLDQYKPHYSPDAKELLENLKTDSILIPAGCTSLVQPADVSWNKPFKTKLRELWTEWMRDTTRKLTKSGKLKAPRRQDVINWISEAWHCVTKETIINSFLYTGIATAMNGSQDHLIRNNIEPEESPADNSEEALEIQKDESMQKIMDIFNAPSDDEFSGFDEDEIDEIEPFDSDEDAAIPPDGFPGDDAGPSCSYAAADVTWSTDED